MLLGYGSERHCGTYQLSRITTREIVVSTQLQDGQYKIVSALSGKVLEIRGEGANDGTPVDQYDDNNKPHQRWQLRRVVEENGEAFFVIEHPNSSKVMEAPGPWNPGDPIVVRDYEEGDDKSHRQWKLEPVPRQEEVYTIRNRRSNLVIDIEGGADSGQVKQYESWDSHDGRQHWKLILAEHSTVTPTTKVPVAVELFHHPLGRTSDHSWTKDQRSVVLVEDAPYLKPGEHGNPIADFPTGVSAIKIHPGPDYNPRVQYEVHLFTEKDYGGEHVIRTVGLGDPNLHWQIDVGDRVSSIKFVTPSLITLP
jgi:hypothetical protein